MPVLYENEKVRVWNPTTGELDAIEPNAEVDQVVSEGRSLESMKGSEGWRILEAILATSIEDYKQKLAYEEDVNRIRRLQEAVKAYSNVLLFVDSKIAEGRALIDNKPDPSNEG